MYCVSRRWLASTGGGSEWMLEKIAKGFTFWECVDCAVGVNQSVDDHTAEVMGAIPPSHQDDKCKAFS